MKNFLPPYPDPRGPSGVEVALALVELELELGIAAEPKVAAREPWRDDLAQFAQHASGGAWLPYGHCLYAADIIRKRIEAGGARLIFNWPPRHGKSELLSKWLPAWFLDRWPQKKVITASYGAELAVDWSRQVQTIFDANALACRLSGARGGWKTVDRVTGRELGGGLKAVGVGGPITGFGGDLQILDDPTKNWQEAHSQASKSAFRGWWPSTFRTRLEPGGSIIVMMTRWTDDDATGYLLDSMREGTGDEWEIIRLPAVAEDSDPMGRAPGDALCPERYDVGALADLKQQVGSFVWSAMYQQSPMILGGNLVRRDWFKFWREMPDVSTFDQIIQSWDMSFTDQGSSFAVGQVWGAKGALRYLLDQVRGKMSFVDAKRAVISLSAKWPTATAKVIEYKANGPAIISELEDTVTGLIPWPPKGEPMPDKVTRFIAESPSFEAGNVLLPSPDKTAWVHDYIEEMLVFPNGKNDDQVDTTSQALAYLRQRPFELLVGWS